MKSSTEPVTAVTRSTRVEPDLFAHRSRSDWLARHDEPVLEPGLPIVDAHHHLWDWPGNRYLLDELRGDIDEGHRIVATVHVQCGNAYLTDGPAALRPVGETRFVQAIAEQAAVAGGPRVADGIVAFADLRDPAIEAVLAAHRQAAGTRLKGIRQSVVWDADRRLVNPRLDTVPDMLRDLAFGRGFARLAPLGLVFDVWALHPQLDDVLALARAFPDTTLVLDHLGGPTRAGRHADRPDDARADWLRGLRALAACPNVVVKLGGFGLPVLGLGLGPGLSGRTLPPDSAMLAQAIRPWVEPCIDAFGPDRCLFESNFPVDRGAARYKVWWNAFKRATTDLSAPERDALFRGTASRVYRLT